MTSTSSNVKIPRIKYGKSSQLTNFILDSCENCHMTPYISDFIPVSLVETDENIKVADGNFVTTKQTGQVQIEMRDDNVESFIDTLYNVLFAPDLCNQLLYITKLMNLGHTYFFS